MSAAKSKGGISGALTGALGRLSALRVGVGTRAVLEASILCLVVVLAILFRVLPLRWGPYFTAYDPLFQYRMTEYVVKNGYAAWFSWHDSLSWYPMGRNVAHSSFPGIPFSAAFVYQVLHALGLNVSVRDVCLFFPILMASLTCVAAYFLGRDLGGGGTGLFAAFFMAVSTAFIGRTTLGFFDTENIGIFGMVAISLFFLRSIEEERPLGRRVIYAVAAGISLAYLYASWGAARYVTGLLMLFMVASLPTKLYHRRYLTSYCFTMGVGYLFAILVPKLGPMFLLSVENVAVLGLALVLLLYEAIRGRIRVGRILLTAGVLLVTLVGGVLALRAVGVTTPLGNKFIRVLNPASGVTNPLLESVGEHKKATWSSFFGEFGLTLSLALLGSYFALRKVEAKRLFGVIFFVSAIYFAGSMIRLSLVLSIPVSLMAAYGLRGLLSQFVSVTSRGAADRRLRRRRAMFGVSRELGGLFLVFILVATLPTVWGAASAAYRPTSLASSGGVGTQDWLQALAWMRDNLPDDAVVVSWWDYGYWIEAMANKTTLADGATRNQHQIAQIARIMMSNQSRSLPILEKYGATHIVVFQTFDPRNPSRKLGLGEYGKWIWMAKIGGFNETDYYDPKTGDYTQKFRDSTLYRLLNMNADPVNFKLAYSSKNNFVLVYEVKY